MQDSYAFGSGVDEILRCSHQKEIRRRQLLPVFCLGYFGLVKSNTIQRFNIRRE